MSDAEPFEIVDAHVHLWDLRGHPAWYPSLSGEPQPGEDGGLGDISGLRRDYLLPDYDADTRRYRVRKMVHVSATQGHDHYLHETRWLDELSAEHGRPHALIAAIDPGQPLAAIEAELDSLELSPVMRGLRVVFGLDPAAATTHELLRMLEERGLIFELVAHPHNAQDFARLFDRRPNLRVVLEHTGWPTAPDEPGHFEQWRAGLRALAAREGTMCKLSGLPMALHSVDVQRMRPWLEEAIQVFGVDRCMFASNFPVDRLFGSFDDIFGAYRQVTQALGSAAQHQLFAQNAERIYNL